MNLFLRYFSLGLFLASLIIFIFFYYFEEPEINAEDFATEDLIELVEEEGYRVITEKEYISYTVNEDNNDTKDSNDDNEKKEKDEDKEEKEKAEKKKKEEKEKAAKEKKEEKEKEKDDIVEYTINIKEGMASQEVSSLLEENKVIKNAEEFSVFIQTNNYSDYIQPGKFKLKSDMSEEEIAKIITNR